MNTSTLGSQSGAVTDTDLAGLVDRIQASSDRSVCDEVFDQLYRLSVGELKAWIAYRCHRWDMIEECLQLTYITAYRHLAQFDRSRPLLPWLKGIARNEIGKYLRALRSDTATGQMQLIDAQLARLEEDPVAEVELAPRLAQCLQRLDQGVREMVWQRYVEQYSVQSMASKVGRSPNAISVALHRAREVLRRCLMGASA